MYILRSTHQKQHDPKIGPNLSDRGKWPSRSGSTDHGPLHHFKVKGKASKIEKITENWVKIGYTTDIIMRQLMISTEIDDLVLGWENLISSQNPFITKDERAYFIER